MTPRVSRLCLLAGFASATLSLSAQPPGSPPPGPAPISAPPAGPAPEGTVAPAPRTSAAFTTDDETINTFRLNDAPIDMVLAQLEGWTGRTILRPQQLPTPTITINIQRPMAKSDAIAALETLLNLNGIGLIPVGDKFLKVVDLPRVRMESPQMIDGSSLDLPPSGQVMSKLFQLEFQRVTEFLPQINMLLNGNIGGYVVFEKSNAALITDSVSTLQRIELLIKKLDQPLTAGLSPKFYQLRNGAKASDVVNKINAIVQGPLQSQLGTATRFSADDRSNQIILMSDPRQYPFFDDLIAKLDVKADPNTRNEVIYLKHAASKDVATLISTLVSGQTKNSQSSGSVRPVVYNTPRQPNQPNQPVTPEPVPTTINLGELGVGTNEFSSLVNVQADDRSNAVVVSGTVDDIRLIQDLVGKIDVLLAQVRIEVVIAEVTLEDDSTSGIDSLGLNIVGNKLVGLTFNASSSGLNVGGVGDGTFATITRPGDTGYVGSAHLSLAGLVSLKTTPRKSNSKVISEPTIVTTHNKEARIFVGESRPTISSYLNDTSSTSTGSSTLGGYRSTVSQTDIGIELKVKPLIGNDGSVQLEITQRVNDSPRDVTIDGNPQPVISKRETESFISVKSGDVIVMGGMQSRSDSRSSSRLGPIPIIGDLFGSRSRKSNRTDLIFFLRPYVLNNDSTDNEDALIHLQRLPIGKDVQQLLNPKPPAPTPAPAEKDDRPMIKRPH